MMLSAVGTVPDRRLCRCRCCYGCSLRHCRSGLLHDGSLLNLGNRLLNLRLDIRYRLLLYCGLAVLRDGYGLRGICRYRLLRVGSSGLLRVLELRLGVCYRLTCSRCILLGILGYRLRICNRSSRGGSIRILLAVSAVHDADADTASYEQQDRDG